MLGGTRPRSTGYESLGGRAEQGQNVNASISSNGVPVTASGSFNLLGPQATDSTSLHVGIDTGSAGVRSGGAITLVSDGAGTTGLGQTTLPSQTVNVSGNVYRLADPTLNTGSLTLAARVGDASPLAAISVTDTSPDAFTEGLKATMASAPARFTAIGTIMDLAAGGTDSSSLKVGLNTATAGSFSGTARLGFRSHNPDLADVVLADEDVALMAQVNHYANGDIQQTGGAGSLGRVGNTYTLDLGNLTQGSGFAASLLRWWLPTASLNPAPSIWLAALGLLFMLAMPARRRNI